MSFELTLSAHPKWCAPQYLNDGETVWLILERLDVDRVRVVRCHVMIASGNMARVYELPFGLPMWLTLTVMLVPPDDPRHPEHPPQEWEEPEDWE